MVRAAPALALVLALAPALARADLPPDPDSPDAHCTPAEQCPSGENCPYSFNPGDPEASKAEGAECRIYMKNKGLEPRCRNGGNYSGQQLFCPPGATGSWTPPGREPPPAPPPVAPAPANPEPPPPAPTKAPANPEPPTKAGMCSLADGPDPGLLALLAGLLLPRRRR